jgi:hypothetical protein
MHPKSAKFFFRSLPLIQKLQIQKENVFFIWWPSTAKTTPCSRWAFFKNTGKFIDSSRFIPFSSPDYPINEQDLDGNTPLLIAYMNGQAALCVALAKAGSVLAKPNSEGITIFNLEVATKRFVKDEISIFNQFRLLHRILDQVEKEPPWVETDRCQITEEKFSMRLRKHHCRHCGSCVCEKVSVKVFIRLISLLGFQKSSSNRKIRFRREINPRLWHMLRRFDAQRRGQIRLCFMKTPFCYINEYFLLLCPDNCSSHYQLIRSTVHCHWYLRSFLL